MIVMWSVLGAVALAGLVGLIVLVVMLRRRKPRASGAPKTPAMMKPMEAILKVHKNTKAFLESMEAVDRYRREKAIEDEATYQFAVEQRLASLRAAAKLPAVTGIKPADGG